MTMELASPSEASSPDAATLSYFQHAKANAAGLAASTTAATLVTAVVGKKLVEQAAYQTIDQARDYLVSEGVDGTLVSAAMSDLAQHFTNNTLGEADAGVSFEILGHALDKVMHRAGDIGEAGMKTAQTLTGYDVLAHAREILNDTALEPLKEATKAAIENRDQLDESSTLSFIAVAHDAFTNLSHDSAEKIRALAQVAGGEGRQLGEMAVSAFKDNVVNTIKDNPGKSALITIGAVAATVAAGVGAKKLSEHISHNRNERKAHRAAADAEIEDQRAQGREREAVGKGR